MESKAYLVIERMVNSPEDRQWWISFIEEGIGNPDYYECVGCRVEIREDWMDGRPYPVNELSFLTKKRDEFWKFREDWDSKSLNRQQLGRFAVELQLRFLDGVKNGGAV